jgi:hypothetical protein
MLWRVQIRNTTVTLLAGVVQDAGAVVPNKDTPTPDTKQSSIAVFVDDKKAFDYGGAPEARTTATVTIDVSAYGKSKEEAEALLDTLCGLIEDTLFGSPTFVQLFEMIDSCSSFSDYKGAEGKYHFAFSTIEIKGHTHETWATPAGADLSGLNIIVASFDPNDPTPAITATAAMATDD